LLRENPEISNRQIAKQVGVNNSTVSRIRDKMEKSGDVLQCNTSIDTLGREQPRQRKELESIGQIAQCNRQTSDGRVYPAQRKELEATAEIPQSGQLLSINSSIGPNGKEYPVRQCQITTRALYITACDAFIQIWKKHPMPVTCVIRARVPLFCFHEEPQEIGESRALRRCGALWGIVFHAPLATPGTKGPCPARGQPKSLSNIFVRWLFFTDEEKGISIVCTPGGCIPKRPTAILRFEITLSAQCGGQTISLEGAGNPPQGRKQK